MPCLTISKSVPHCNCSHFLKGPEVLHPLTTHHVELFSLPCLVKRLLIATHTL